MRAVARGWGVRAGASALATASRAAWAGSPADVGARWGEGGRPTGEGARQGRAGPTAWAHDASRGFRAGPAARHGGAGGDDAAAGAQEKIEVTFVEPEGAEHTVQATVGRNMLQVAHDFDIELEGACECSLACSTCHVILDQEVYDKLDPPCEDEEDMLDLAFGLTETSRLGCQIIARDGLQGMRMRLPSATRNMAVDGFKPKPH